MAGVEVAIADMDYNLSKNITMPENTDSGSWKPRGRKLKYKRPTPGVVTVCKICGLESPPHAPFHIHIKPHEKPFACNMCGSSFGRKPYLDVHLRTHTGERPYECMLCQKRFTQKSSLNTHMKVHTGERPFTCEICHKGFALKSYLAAHRWSHVTKEEMICGVCSTAFTSKTVLMAHLRTHHSSSRSQPQTCNICGRRFLRGGYLARHQAQAHSVLEVTPSIQVGTGDVNLDEDDNEEDEDDEEYGDMIGED